MCLAVFTIRPDQEIPFLAYETRDQSIHLRHGHRAAAALDLPDIASYGYHWQRSPQLLDRVWNYRARSWSGLADEPVLGGLDGGGGTWLAIHQRTGVYARILIAPMSSGGLGESPSGALRQQRQSLGYVTRSGVCLDAVTYPTAAQAAAGLRTELPAALARDNRAMLPFFLLVADSSDAFVVHHRDSGGVEVTRVADNVVQVLSVRGLNSPEAALTGLLRDRLAGTPLPTAEPASWDPWLAAFSLTGRVSDEDYLAPQWRAHRSSPLQPPYLNTQGADRHQRAPWPSTADPGEVEWTKSTTCTAIGRQGLLTLMYDERHVEPGQPWPAVPSAARFPQDRTDYTVVTSVDRLTS